MLPSHDGEKEKAAPSPALPPKFQDLVALLSEAYTRDLGLVQKDCEKQLTERKKEIQELKAQLEEAGLQPRAPRSSTRTVSSFDPRPIRATAMMSSDGKDFELKTAWEEEIDGSVGNSLDTYLTRSSACDKSLEEARGEADQSRMRRWWNGDKKFVILPNSDFRMNWDCAGLVLIFYDLITIPFNQAFQPEPGWFSISMDWITLLFWSSDMMQGFFLAYFDSGHIVTDNCKILKHYLTTWFVADVLVCGPEWLMKGSEMGLSPTGETSAAGAGKILKTARAVRVLRLLRLAKIQRMLNLLYDLIESEYTFILINLTKLLVSVLVLNHVVACGWYLTGVTAMDSDMESWIVASRVIEKDIPYAYSTSLHWSLTQFTPASMDVSAKNILERIFSIVILFFAMVVFSSIVGSISGSMTTLRSMKSDQMKQFWLLRRYLRQRDVSKDLSSRIHKYLEHTCTKQNCHVQPCQLRILDGLSESLQNELTHQMHSPHLLEHPFFKYLNEEMEIVMHRLCRLALKPQSYAEREYIFGAGDEAKKMFFVKTGALEYMFMDHSPLRPPPQQREWISEALLWTSWRHQGDLLAMIESELISLDPSQFLQVMSIHPRPWFYSRHYAYRYIKFLNHLGKARVSDIIRHEHFYQQAVDGIESTNGSGHDATTVFTEGTDDLREAAKSGAVEEVNSSNEAWQDSTTLEDVMQAGASPRSKRFQAPFRRRFFGFCPCPAPFSSVVPGPNVAMSGR